MPRQRVSSPRLSGFNADWLALAGDWQGSTCTEWKTRLGPLLALTSYSFLSLRGFHHGPESMSPAHPYSSPGRWSVYLTTTERASCCTRQASCYALRTARSRQPGHCSRCMSLVSEAVAAQTVVRPCHRRRAQLGKKPREKPPSLSGGRGGEGSVSGRKDT